MEQVSRPKGFKVWLAPQMLHVAWRDARAERENHGGAIDQTSASAHSLKFPLRRNESSIEWIET
jgi:hypothetical protein